ncbi:MAG: hypothetical protein QM786_07375 [Breznakibacter sp.]
MKPVVLICYAVDREHVVFDCPHLKLKYCKTGVGKVEAALSVMEAIRLHNPVLVVNVATAGTVLHEVGSIHLCTRFVDRDMEKLTAFGVPCHEDFSNEPQLDLGGLVPTSVCNTGDTFMTEGGGTGDVFDMEAFAIARVCRLAEIPFVAVKYATDVIGQNSVKHWVDKLADAREGLKAYMENEFLAKLVV